MILHESWYRGFLFGFAAMVFSMQDMHQTELPLRGDWALAQEVWTLPGMHLNSGIPEWKAGREIEEHHSQLSNQSVPAD